MKHQDGSKGFLSEWASVLAGCLNCPLIPKKLRRQGQDVRSQIMHKLVLLVLWVVPLANFWCLQECLVQTAITELNVPVCGVGRKTEFKLSLKGREGRTCSESFTGSLHIRQWISIWTCLLGLRFTVKLSHLEMCEGVRQCFGAKSDHMFVICSK